MGCSVGRETLIRVQGVGRYMSVVQNNKLRLTGAFGQLVLDSSSAYGPLV